MILDTIENLERYKKLLPGIEGVVDYLKEVDFFNLPQEKVYLDGDKLFVIPSVGSGKKAEDALLEAHNSYADIQVCLSRKETFGWRNRATCIFPMNEFDGEKDIVFYSDKPTSFVTIGSKEFVLFMPGDAHAPLIFDGEIVKLIFKVKVV